MLKFFNLFFLALMRKDLPHDVEPNHYDLQVTVEPEGFSGTVRMHLNAKKSIERFKFNSKNLALSNLEVKKENEVWETTFSEEDEFVDVKLKKSIEGDFIVSVGFKGVYSNTMEGFYKSKYNSTDLFSTHFEPADARQAFPCFDQPDMKATFSITLNAPEGYMALSNSPLLEQTGNRFIFEKTPKMSTYIVAYVIGQLEYIEDSSHIPIRVYADGPEKEWGKFALDVATRCLKFYEKYFEVGYPLKKLDMVAIPSFAMGAMENWGLVTYRKTSLLFDEKSTPLLSKKNIAETVCHELAHMWFGNLVTMRWWSDLWLNEGFATWAATLAVHHALQDILPWDAWTSFINDEIESGMGMDCRKSTHKIGKEVEDPIEINQIFDAISYSKGSSVIKMLENWLGAEVFRKGLVHYIKKFSYSNAVTSDLWESLTAVAKQEGLSDIDVASVIDPWVSRDGFPYLTVEDEEKSISLLQKRFTVGYRKEDGPWPIPVRILWIAESESSPGTKRSKATDHLSSVTIMSGETLEMEKKSHVYKLNHDVSGFYRVQYPENMVKQLLDYTLSTANRMNLYSDSFALSMALYSPLQASLSLVEYLAIENSYEVLRSVLGSLAGLRSVFYDNPKKLAYFNEKMASVIRGRIGQINLKEYPKDLNTVSMHSLVVARAVNLSLPEILEKIDLVKLNEINPEYLRAYLVAKIDSDFESTFKLYKETTRPGEKQSALYALGATTVEKNVDFIFDHIETIEAHDSIYIFISLSGNLEFRNKAAAIFIEQFERIRKHIVNSGLIRHAIEYLLGNVYQMELQSKVMEFLKSIKEDRELTSAIDKCHDLLKIGNDMRAMYSGVDFE